jgi:dihydrofolate reductase
MRISVIAALAENRVIGNRNMLPWRLPADLKHFRQMTTGCPVVMGRRSFESIGRPLPQRTNIVVTRQSDFRAPGCLIVHSLESAFAACHAAADVFVMGGAEIYAQTVDRAHRLCLTLVHTVVAGDTFFPSIDWAAWRETARSRHEADERHACPFSFVTFERAA